MTVTTSVVDPADTVWPVERPTAATVPAIGLTSWAAVNDCSASINDAFAESIDAWSVANCSGLSEAAVPLPPLGVVVPPFAPLVALLVSFRPLPADVVPLALLVGVVLPPVVLRLPVGAVAPVFGAVLGVLGVVVVVGAVPVPPEPPRPVVGLEEEDEEDWPSSWARAFSAAETAAWSAATCC
jgi:hypothetical protein